MKAIVNLSKNSAYSRLNGHTFEVKQLLLSIVALNVNGRIIDFIYSEVIIVDIQGEVRQLRDLIFMSDNEKDHQLETGLKRLEKYVKLNNIVLDPI